jgi:hypothetical protein
MRQIKKTSKVNKGSKTNKSKINNKHILSKNKKATCLELPTHLWNFLKKYAASNNTYMNRVIIEQLEKLKGSVKTK